MANAYQMLSSTRAFTVCRDLVGSAFFAMKPQQQQNGTEHHISRVVRLWPQKQFEFSICYGAMCTLAMLLSTRANVTWQSHKYIIRLRFLSFFFFDFFICLCRTRNNNHRSATGKVESSITRDIFIAEPNIHNDYCYYYYYFASSFE